MRYPLLVLAALLPGGALAAQKPPSPSAQPAQAHVFTPEHLTWGPAPSILPAGARLAVLEGDPSKTGPYTMRLEMPAGYRIPPHFHPADEHVTVISGAFQVGMGDTFDEGKLTTLPRAGSRSFRPACATLPAPTRPRWFSCTGRDPWRLTYVNPANRPSTVEEWEVACG